MKQVVIENPILNSPFEEPRRHFRFGEEGLTNEIVISRRSSSSFIPIPAAKNKSQLVLDTERVGERIEVNAFISWAFVEISDPWDAESMIRAALAGSSARESAPDPAALV